MHNCKINAVMEPSGSPVTGGPSICIFDTAYESGHSGFMGYGDLFHRIHLY